MVKKRWKGTNYEKKIAVGFGICLFIIYTILSLVFAVDFDMPSYQGDLNIHADNTAILKKQLPTALEMIIMVS